MSKFEIKHKAGSDPAIIDYLDFLDDITSEDDRDQLLADYHRDRGIHAKIDGDGIDALFTRQNISASLSSFNREDYYIIYCNKVL